MDKEQISILAVEDDKDLLELTSAILGADARVDCSIEPADALRRMVEKHYDLLVTDLSITHAGDGLILAGAMRHLQPTARTVLITGYPDFTSALAAMQGTLDMILLKPVEVADIRRLPQLSRPPVRATVQVGRKTIWVLIEEQKTELLKQWLVQVEADTELAKRELTPAERMDHMEEILGEMSNHGAGPQQRPQELRKAGEHGHVRREQQYRPEWIAREVSYLRRVIFDLVLRELLQLDLSRLPGDLFTLNLAIDSDMLLSLRTFGLLAA